MEFKFPDGGTPLDPDDMEGLIIPTISTRDELDRFEFENIRQAVDWLAKHRKSYILSEEFLRKLHFRMFGNVWKWAGRYRSSGKNIGVPVGMIHEETAKLIGDTRFWVKERPMSENEIGATFHYRLLWIHSFPNGNGRHGRLMTDLLLERELGVEKFTWGGGNVSRQGEVRKHYIEAMKEGDRGNLNPLIEFVRS